MTFSNFQRLSENEKANYLWEHGKPVAERKVGNARFTLYQVKEFYVEVEYKTDFTEVVNLHACQVKDLPVVYLDNLDIGGSGH
ncbi:MAG: hypothetical protein K0Q66_564 [Chitinophagaceae bacterium]|nr:hypothetical protein [Chitinophagaceae bacterium]